jgi:S1-C subfamily serine protease
VGHGHGAIWSLAVGVVTNIYRQETVNEGRHPALQTQMPVNPGSSGGPIVDRLGRVVGIVTTSVEGALINFGIPIDVARASLPKLAEAARCLTVRAPRGVPIFVDGAMVGVGPVVVLPPPEREVELAATAFGQLSRRKVTGGAAQVIELFPAGDAGVPAAK